MQKSPHFHLAMLHPRYWLTWFGLGLLCFTAQLPYRLQIVLGLCVGRLSYYLVSRRRKIAETNIALCFPEKSAAEQRALVKAHFDTNGIALFEIGMAWFMPYWRLRKRFVVKGKDNWQSLLVENQGALVVGLHFNSLEIANVQVDREVVMHTSYRPHSNPVYDWVQYHRRRRHNAHSETLTRKDIRGMVKVLKRGDFLWYAPDQDYGSKFSEFVPWFGQQAATLSATPRLLSLAKVPLAGLVYRRQAGYRGYEIEFLPIIEGLPSGDHYADLLRINQHIEACVRDNSVEYLWVHRRFKTRPAGEASVY